MGHTNEVLDLCNQRQQLRQQKYTNSEAGLEYKKVNREARKKIEGQCKNIEKRVM